MCTLITTTSFSFLFKHTLRRTQAYRQLAFGSFFNSISPQYKKNSTYNSLAVYALLYPTSFYDLHYPHSCSLPSLHAFTPLYLTIYWLSVLIVPFINALTQCVIRSTITSSLKAILMLWLKKLWWDITATPLFLVNDKGLIRERLWQAIDMLDFLVFADEEGQGGVSLHEIYFLEGNSHVWIVGIALEVFLVQLEQSFVI